jgi:hypothetical protein
MAAAAAARRCSTAWQPRACASPKGYANSSVCSPTRFALATGRWQHRLRAALDYLSGGAHFGKIGLRIAA